MESWLALTKSHIRESIATQERLFADAGLCAEIDNLISLACSSLDKGGCVFFCGNGGSYGDALHLAAELTGRFKCNRKAIASHCLGSNGAALTAIGNDFGFDSVFSRDLEALGNKDDLLVLLSTSGNSQNLIATLHAALQIPLTVFSLLGKDGGKLAQECEHSLIVPSDDTAHVQEAHIVIGHIVCDAIEQYISGKKQPLIF